MQKRCDRMNAQTMHKETIFPMLLLSCLQLCRSFRIAIILPRLRRIEKCFLHILLEGKGHLSSDHCIEWGRITSTFLFVSQFAVPINKETLDNSYIGWNICVRFMCVVPRQNRTWASFISVAWSVDVHTKKDIAKETTKLFWLMTSIQMDVALFARRDHRSLKYADE